MTSSHYNLRSTTALTDDKERLIDSSADSMSHDDMQGQLLALQQEINQLRGSQTPQPESTRIDALRRVHVPKFSKANPHLWFAQLERSFRLSGITSDADQFDIISIRLEDDVLITIEDLLARPPQSNKYEALKTRLLTKFAESAESKLRRLLQGGETTGIKPSEVLDHMKRLAPDPGSEAVIRTLFLGQMPKTVRPLLTVWEEEDLDKLAQVADKMVEAVSVCSVSVLSGPQHVEDPTVQSVSSSGNMSMRKISTVVQSLSAKIDKMENDLRKLKSHRYASRSRSQSHPEQRGEQRDSAQRDGPLCFYHKKFGNDARQCRPPCAQQPNLN